MKMAALHNLGCKVNAYDTEAMEELRGYNRNKRAKKPCSSKTEHASSLQGIYD